MDAKVVVELFCRFSCHARISAHVSVSVLSFTQ